MSHPIPWYDPADEVQEMEYHAPQFTLMQRVQTSEGRIGHVTGYGEGRLNIRVTFEQKSLWYSEAELKAV